MMSIVPTTTNTSLMRYEVYRHKDTSPEDFKKDLDFYKQVESEDKWLAGGSQLNFDNDTYTVGPLHPDVEEAVTYVTKLVKKMLQDHVNEEKSRGEQWWPARRVHKLEGMEEDEAFCRNVCASSVSNETGGDDVLAW